jgi:hypothetical protein
MEAPGVNLDEADVFDPLASGVKNLDLDGGNKEIKDKDITLDLLEDIFFQMFDQDGDLNEEDSFYICILLVDFNIDKSAMEFNNITCELLDDDSVVTFER